MSSFSENFEREENKETQYDDGAFYTFAFGMLCVGSFILIILIVRRLFYSTNYTGKEYKNCKCSPCRIRLEKHNNSIKKQNLNRTFIIYILIWLFFCYLSFLCYNEVVKNSGKLKTFDPYEILEISPGLDEKSIKKAYKKLALKYHPDKNPNNLQAKAKFILITKAYDALTNEEGRKNYEKYGNPDGPGSMKLSVGLPSFVLEKKNHMSILILFVIFIWIILPTSFWMWHSSSTKYNDSGMLVTDQAIFYQFLNENILLKQMPFVMGLAKEYSSLPIRADETEILFSTYKKNLDLMSKHKIEAIPPSNKKAICWLYAYLNNTPMNYKNYESDLETVLKPTNIFITNMYKMAIELTQIRNFGRNDIKNFGYNCISTIFEFSQNITQQISHTNNSLSPFSQIPHLTDNKIKLWSRNNRKVFNNKPTVFKDFISMPKEERNQIWSSEFSKEEVDEMNYAIEAIPQYEVTYLIQTEGFDDIVVEDLVTFKFIITRLNLEEGLKWGVNHSCSYPEIFKEQVSIAILVEKNIIYQAVVDITTRETIHEFKNPVKQEGKFTFTLQVCPLNYKGLDQVMSLPVEAKRSSEMRKIQLKSIEKREIKKIEPSYFQSLLNQVVPYQGDDEDEEEEEEDNDKDKNKTKDKNEDEKKEDKNEVLAPIDTKEGHEKND